MAEFSLNVNDIKEEVDKSLKEEEEKIPNPEIKKQADDNAHAIFEANFDNVAERENILKPLDDFGLATINRSANKNNLLTTRFVDIAKGGDEAANIGVKLEELEREIRNLDPAAIEFGQSGILGKLLKPVRNYFSRYEKADEAISNILMSLDASSRVLQNDNTTLLAEENYLRELTKKLMTDIELGKQMDLSIEQQIRQAEIEGVDQYKIDFVREEVLFPLRQRIMDMQQMIVVNEQGIISLNVVRRNNKELIRGVTRAKNVTVTALRNGVMVASALYNQKIVIDKIKTLNETTEMVIESTSKMLREQGNEIQKQSMETMISPEVLKASFADALAAIEDVSNYKNQALPEMQKTIATFSEMAEEGQKVIDKIEVGNNVN
ncbi:toxic anion resistance protein [Methanobrevibacter sp.]|uniref:toxic anion resistance protein n=1 Tax=Methanobrevibacter sp. TaxID=66852 RepID=UPI0025FA73C5|nr:toxic anion resistance protein [Methanobrevibacter sp.]MBQ2962843.1 toxic anion resistance protein [Methanobrevibacter sp.]